MKKANLALISAVILFSIINVSLVQAGTVTVKVQYQDGCPRNGAYIKEVHCRGLYIFTYLTDENGYTSDTGFPPDTLCWFQAFWPNLGSQFGPQMIIKTDGNGDGSVTITHNTLNYPNGAETCGSYPCNSTKYCYSGNPPYVQCGSWQTDCGTCCQCNDGTQWNPSQSYDQTQNNDCNPFDIATCFNSPDALDFTWDFRDSICTGIDTCSQGEITHTCNQQTCGADCDEHADCEDKCIGEIRYYSGSCALSSTCTCSYTTEDCNIQDDWYNTTNTQWISTGQCTEKEQKQQEYRDYTCSAAACTYSVTNTRWIDTGQTRNKANGTSCNDGLYCTNPDTCTSGICGGSTRNCSSSNLEGIATCDYVPDAIHFTWDFRQAFISICNETSDSCTTGNPTISHTCDKSACGAQCTQATAATDCPITKVCLSDCTCSLDTTPPVINILSPASNYSTSTIPLTFTLSEPSSWCAYSLDGKANSTIWGCKNTTLYLYTSGNHNVIVYAKDYSGNTGASTKEYFTAIFSIGGGGSGCGFRSCLRM